MEILISTIWPAKYKRAQRKNVFQRKLVEGTRGQVKC